MSDSSRGIRVMVRVRVETIQESSPGKRQVCRLAVVFFREFKRQSGAFISGSAPNISDRCEMRQARQLEQKGNDPLGREIVARQKGTDEGEPTVFGSAEVAGGHADTGYGM
jgi:hypothetical protein